MGTHEFKKKKEKHLGSTAARNGSCSFLRLTVFVFFLSMAEGEKLQAKMEKLEKQYNSLQVLSTITKLGTKEVYSQSSILRS